MTKAQPTETMLQDKIEKLIEKRENNKWERLVKTADKLMEEFLQDIKSLQSEQPEAPISKKETTVKEVLIYEAGYNEWLADGKSRYKPIIKVWTQILDDWIIKTISRLFTVSQISIEDETQNRREDVYVEFEWYWGDRSLIYIKENCKILLTLPRERMTVIDDIMNDIIEFQQWTDLCYVWWEYNASSKIRQILTKHLEPQKKAEEIIDATIHCDCDNVIVREWEYVCKECGRIKISNWYKIEPQQTNNKAECFYCWDIGGKCTCKEDEEIEANKRDEPQQEDKKIAQLPVNITEDQKKYYLEEKPDIINMWYKINEIIAFINKL